MAANVKKPSINLREHVARQAAHHHDEEYWGKDQQIGKNIFINSDKRISQRVDYSTPQTITSNSLYTLDRYLTEKGTIVSYSLEQLSSASPTNSDVARIEVVTGSVGGFLALRQRIENYEALQGKTVTFTAEIRSNIPTQLSAYDGAAILGGVIKGTSDWKTVSFTFKLADVNTFNNLNVSIGTVSGTSDTYVGGEYIEVGMQQLELGEEFTGFEPVDPSIELARCRRYFQKVTTRDTLNEVIGIGQAIGTTTAYFPIPFSTMRAAPTVSYSSVGHYSLTNSGGGVAVATAFTPALITDSSFRLQANVASGLVAGNATWLLTTNAAATMDLDAEI